MTKIVLLYYFVAQCYITITLGQDATLLVPIFNDTIEDDDLNLPPDLDLNDTSILRVGHRTHDCQDFKKAYVCIMKCLELGYHIAESNDKCVCTCFKDYVKGKYFGGVKPGWKVPTTSLPPWAVQINDESEGELTTTTEAVTESETYSTGTDNTDSTVTGETDETEGEGEHEGEDGEASNEESHEGEEEGEHSEEGEHGEDTHEAEGEGDAEGEGGDDEPHSEKAEEP